MAGWKRVEEIIAYQLGVKLRDWVLADIDSGRIPRDFKYRDQMADAARSVPANIAEGFDLYAHGRFGFHVGVAKGSLGELEAHLKEARKREFLNDQEHLARLTLLIETRRTTTGLLRHLKTSEAPQPWTDVPNNPSAAENDT
jgi:four helix bundle protein